MLPAAPATPGPPVPPGADARFDVLRPRSPGQGVQAGSPPDAEAAARRRAGLPVPPAVTVEPGTVLGPAPLMDLPEHLRTQITGGCSAAMHLRPGAT
jgi:hypothetical protein